MKYTLTPREQRTLAVVLCLAAVLVWVYSAYIVGPLWKEFQRLNQQVQNAQDELKGLEMATANEAALRTQHEQVHQTVMALRGMLPSADELPAVIEQLSSLAGPAQIRIQTILPQHDSDDTNPGSRTEVLSKSTQTVVYDKTGVAIDALAGYHQLGTYLSLVESLDKPVELSQLRITADEKEPRRHHVKMLIRAYFAASDTPTTDAATKRARTSQR